MTYKTLIDEGKRIIDSPDGTTEAMLLLEYVLHTDRNELLIHPEKEVKNEDADTFMKLAGRRASGEPVQYIIGSAPFYGLEFIVNPSVLIPRFDTEVLVEEVLKAVKEDDKILDLCTGSGCIAVSIKKYKPGAQIYASDISMDAIKIAKGNAEANDTDITFIHSDLLDNVGDGYDIIVSNPPYIKTAVIEGLDDIVKKHEPYIALNGGTDGLDYYRRIVADSRTHLKQGGRLMMEIGYDQGEELKELLKEAGYSNIEIKKDLSGNDRVAMAVFGG